MKKRRKAGSTRAIAPEPSTATRQSDCSLCVPCPVRGSRDGVVGLGCHFGGWGKLRLPGPCPGFMIPLSGLGLRFCLSSKLLAQPGVADLGTPPSEPQCWRRGGLGYLAGPHDPAGKQMDSRVRQVWTRGDPQSEAICSPLPWARDLSWS